MCSSIVVKNVEITMIIDTVNNAYNKSGRVRQASLDK